MTIETLKEQQSQAIANENYELAGEIKSKIERLQADHGSIVQTQEIVDQAIVNGLQNDKLQDFETQIGAAFGEKKIVKVQTNSEPLFEGGPVSQHYSVIVGHDDQWIESPQAVKEGYSVHYPMELWPQIIERVGENFDLSGAKIDCQNHKGGLFERVKIANITNPIELQDDKIFPTLDFWGGHGGGSSIQGNYGQDIFKCSNGLTIRTGKLAASFRKIHKGNLTKEIDLLMVEFVKGIKQWQKQTDTFKIMSETACPDYHKIIAEINGIDAVDVLPSGGLTNNVKTATRKRYNAMLERLRTESDGDKSKVTNWRVAMPIHGYYNHKSNAKGVITGTDDKASDHPATKQAFELLAV